MKLFDMSRTSPAEQAQRQLPSADFGIVTSIVAHRNNEIHGLLEFCIRFYSGYHAWQLYPDCKHLDVVKKYVALHVSRHPICSILVLLARLLRSLPLSALAEHRHVLDHVYVFTCPAGSSERKRKEEEKASMGEAPASPWGTRWWQYAKVDLSVYLVSPL